MRVTIKRLLGLAAVYGIVRYVRANGGPEKAFASLKDKARGFLDSARSGGNRSVGDSNFATNVGRGPRTSVADDNLH